MMNDKKLLWINIIANAKAIGSFLYCFGIALLSPQVTNAAEINLGSDFLFEKSVSSDSQSFESRAAITTKAGSLIVLGVIKSVSAGKKAPVDSGWIGFFDMQGKQVTDIRFGPLIENERIRELDAIAEIGSGIYAVAGQLESGASFLAYIDSQQRVVISKNLGNARISTIIPVGNGDLLLAGHKGRDLLLMKVAQSGRTIFDRTQDRGKDDLFLDGVFDGSRVTLVENSGKREQFFMTASSVGITRLNDDGTINDPTTAIKGRGGSLAKGKNRFLLVYDVANQYGQGIRVGVFDNELRLLSDNALTETNLGFERFRVTAAGDSGFLVVGTDGGKIRFIKLGEDGIVRWRRDLSNQAYYMHANVAASHSIAYVVATAMVLGDGDRPKKLIRIFGIEVRN